mmetsp:Transcript_25610/g.64536  ORF Transcript_25610/g.64536 Transcript_25610/m.64536 type:complete len:287 (+) Transcript_25610:85-945(+)
MGGPPCTTRDMRASSERDLPLTAAFARWPETLNLAGESDVTSATSDSSSPVLPPALPRNGRHAPSTQPSRFRSCASTGVMWRTRSLFEFTYIREMPYSPSSHLCVVHTMASARVAILVETGTTPRLCVRSSTNAHSGESSATIRSKSIQRPSIQRAWDKATSRTRALCCRYAERIDSVKSSSSVAARQTRNSAVQLDDVDERPPLFFVAADPPAGDDEEAVAVEPPSPPPRISCHGYTLLVYCSSTTSTSGFTPDDSPLEPIDVSGFRCAGVLALVFGEDVAEADL